MIKVKVPAALPACADSEIARHNRFYVIFRGRAGFTLDGMWQARSMGRYRTKHGRRTLIYPGSRTKG